MVNSTYDLELFGTRKVFMATFPIVLVETASTVAPIPPPSKGIAFPKFITPFSPNLVSKRNPTVLFMFLITSKDNFFISCRDNFFPISIPISVKSPIFKISPLFLRTESYSILAWSIRRILSHKFHPREWGTADATLQIPDAHLPSLSNILQVQIFSVKGPSW